MSEYLLFCSSSQMPRSSCSHPGCDGAHEPSEESKMALKDSREGKGAIYSSLDEFWKAMEMKPKVNALCSTLNKWESEQDEEAYKHLE